jgi:hypothetical protein
MRLTCYTFCSHLILHPFEATTKGERIIALVASIACFFFTAGFLHLGCALWRHCTKVNILTKLPSHNNIPRPPTHSTPVTRTSIRAIPLLDRFTVEDVQAEIPAPVYSALGLIFKEPYALQSLPLYPTLVTDESPWQREQISSPVMKGIWTNITKTDNRPFIIIKVKRVLQRSQLKQNQPWKKHYYASNQVKRERVRSCLQFPRRDPKLIPALRAEASHDFIILIQSEPKGKVFEGFNLLGQNMWAESKRNVVYQPHFFTGLLTDALDGYLTDTAAGNAKIFTQLLKGEPATDLQGVTWVLDTEDT